MLEPIQIPRVNRDFVPTQRVEFSTGPEVPLRPLRQIGNLVRELVIDKVFPEEDLLESATVPPTKSTLEAIKIENKLLNQSIDINHDPQAIELDFPDIA